MHRWKVLGRISCWFKRDPPIGLLNPQGIGVLNPRESSTYNPNTWDAPPDE